MTLKDFSELGRADDDWSLESEALQIAGFEKGADHYGDETMTSPNDAAARTPTSGDT